MSIQDMHMPTRTYWGLAALVHQPPFTLERTRQSFGSWHVKKLGSNILGHECPSYGQFHAKHGAMTLGVHITRPTSSTCEHSCKMLWRFGLVLGARFPLPVNCEILLRVVPGNERLLFPSCELRND